jgi:hypothetical protein
MFEMIGLLFATVAFFGLSILFGILFGLAGWLLFLGRRRPKRLILIAALMPPLSAAYMYACAIVFALLVPNQPDVFFGDISEPLPNGYVLTGLGKMPEFSYFDVSSGNRQQPQLLGGVGRLELDGQVVFGAYGHLDSEPAPFDHSDHGYFAFDTRTGQVQNFDSLAKLNAYAEHPVHLVETQFFRSRDPARKRLIFIEDIISFGPPVLAVTLWFFLLLRTRLKPEAEPQERPRWEPPDWETPTN